MGPPPKKGLAALLAREIVARAEDETANAEDQRRAILIVSADTLAEQASIFVLAAREWGDRWEKTQMALVIASSVLASAAGASLFASFGDKRIAGAVSFLAAAFSAITAALTIPKRVSAYREFATESLSLSWAAGDFFDKAATCPPLAKLEADWERIVKQRKTIYEKKEALLPLRSLQWARPRNQSADEGWQATTSRDKPGPEVAAVDGEHLDQVPSVLDTSAARSKKRQQKAGHQDASGNLTGS